MCYLTPFQDHWKPDFIENENKCLQQYTKMKSATHFLAELVGLRMKSGF